MKPSYPLQAVACAVAVAAWVWLAHATALGPQIILALAWNAFLILPAGALVVTALGPGRDHPAARVALTGATGYLATTLLAALLGTLGWIGSYPYVCGALCCAWLVTLWRRWSRRGDDVTALQGQDAWRSAPAAVLLVIVSLSLVAITPILTPIRTVSPGHYISYAYIDAYQSLAMVQGLSRHVPLTEHYSLAGILPRLYPDFHYTYLAMLERVTGATAADTYFCHGAILLVVLGVPLAYAIGRELTGARLGGYIGATLLYLGVLPNVYDLNPTLSNVSVPYMPVFYQTHFYSPRFNQHEGAGAILVLSTVLLLALCARSRDGRSTLGHLVLGGCFVAALARFRSQQLLAVGPAFLIVCVALAAKRRDWRYLAGFVGAGAMLVIVWAQSFGGTYDTGSARLLLRYGDFGWELLEGWYLPARLQPYISQLSALVAPAAAVMVWVGFRVIGLNLAVLILVRVWWLARRRLWPTLPELFCAAALLCATVSTLMIRRQTTTVGFQTLEIGHLLALLLAIAPLSAIVGALGARIARPTVRSLGGALCLVLLTLVAFRAADAAMHDQQHRAYPLTTAELDAYGWIQTHTGEDAVVAAHPDHRVNPSGESIGSTDFLSAMTDRRVFLQRASAQLSAITEERAAQLRNLFATPSPDVLCGLAADINVDYLLEYGDTPLAVHDAPCLRQVFAQGSVRVLALRESAGNPR